MSYSVDNIRFWKDMEHVRLRPTMYIGDLGSDGLHALLTALLDEIRDEAREGHCRRATLNLDEDGSITLEDDGRGIPVGPLGDSRVPTIEVVFTRLGACFCGCRGRPKHRRAHMGLGAAVVNALSESLLVETSWGGQRYRMRFEAGRVVGRLECLGPSSRPGSLIRFLPDRSVFKLDAVLRRVVLLEELESLAALAPGLVLEFEDRRFGTPFTARFECPRGIADLVARLCECPRLARPIASCMTEVDDDEHATVNLAIQIDRSEREHVIGFANGWRADEGTHVAGFIDGVEVGFAVAAKVLGLPACGRRPAGIRGVVYVDLASVEVEGQRADRLANPETWSFVAEATRRAVVSWAEGHPSEARALLGG